jgi:hypothetical protein
MTAHEIKKHLEALNDEMDRMKVKGRFSYVAALRLMSLVRSRLVVDREMNRR